MHTRLAVLAAAAFAVLAPAASAQAATAQAAQYFRCEEKPGTVYFLVRPNEFRQYTPPEFRQNDPGKRGYLSYNLCQNPAAKCDSKNDLVWVFLPSQAHILDTKTGTHVVAPAGGGKETRTSCVAVDAIPYASRMEYAEWVNGFISHRTAP